MKKYFTFSFFISFVIFVLAACSINVADETVIDVSKTSAADRKILNQIFKQNPDNKLRWDTTETNLRNWPDLVITEDGYVSGLYLESKGLSILPSEIGNLEYLTLLDIKNNMLTVLPSDIRKLSRLEQLTASGNYLRALPVGIGQLKNLELLIMDHNRLRSLPAEIGQLSNLRWMYLHYNELTSVPKEIVQLKKLESLSLYDNFITSVPKDVCDFGATLTLSFRLDSNVICQ